MKTFQGRTAVITSAGSGFGLELARRAAGRGMNLVLAAVQRDALDRAVENDRLYIYSHRRALASVRTRLEDIMQARNPADPFVARPELRSQRVAGLRKID